MPIAERNREIATLVRAGHLTFADIGRRFGVSRERIRQIAAAQGVEWKDRHTQHIPAEKIAKAASLVWDGVPAEHAAEMVGLKPSNICRAMTARGLYTPSRHQRAWSEDEISFLRAHYKQGALSAAAIAEKLGRTRREVIGKANRLGLCAPVAADNVSARVRQLLADDPHLTPTQLAKSVGCSLRCAETAKWRACHHEQVRAYQRRHYANSADRSAA